MKKHYFYTILIILLAFPSISEGQCTLDYSQAAFPSEGTVSTTGSNRGQSFVACQSGFLSQLSFRVFSAQNNANDLKIYAGAGTSGELLATVSFADISFAITEPTVVDLSNELIEVQNGATYTFQFTSITNVVLFTSDIYDGGTYLTGGGPNSSFDLTFKIEIEDVPEFFVKKTGSDTNDGSDFSSAFATVQKALEEASAGASIYIAEGTYYPSVGVDFDNVGGITAREATFQIPAGVKVYGGFIGTETSIDLGARDIQTNATVLSGDIGTIGDDSDNAYHVLYTQNAGSSTVVDGLTIRDGNADGTRVSNFSGGGWYNLANTGESSPKITSVVFDNNRAADGGAFFNFGQVTSTANPIFQSVIFVDNQVSGFGGAFRTVRDASSATVIPQFVNCTFLRNDAGSEGGALSSNVSSAVAEIKIRNSIFFENTASANPAIHLTSQRAISSNSMYDRPFLPTRVDDAGNNLLNADPLFEETGLANLADCSPAIDAGDDTFVTDLWDVAGATRIQNGTIDIGAFEAANPAQPVIGLSTSNIDFGFAGVGETLTQTITISNTGTGDLNLTLELAGSNDFTFNTSGLVVAAGSSEDLIVEYSPSLPFASAATSTVISNDCNQPELIFEIAGGGIYSQTFGEPYALGTIAENPPFFSLGSGIFLEGIALSTDGTKAFAVKTNGTSASMVTQFSLSTPYDISTATVEGDYITTSQSVFVSDITFDPSGKRMFITADTDVHQYSLNNAFDITGTVIYDGAYDVGGQALVPTGLAFSHAGKQMYILDNDGDAIYSYQLQTPYELVQDEASSAVVTLNVGDDFSEPQALFFTPDGSKIFVTGNRKVVSYSLSTPYNLSTESGSETLSLSTFFNSPTGIFYSQNQEYLLIAERSSPSVVRGLSFEKEDFTEVVENDGSVSGNIEVSLRGTTFINAGSELVEETHYSISNLPVGLIPVVNVDADGMRATLTLDGTADASETVDNISNLSLNFTDAAFASVDLTDLTTLGVNAFEILFEDNTKTWTGQFSDDWGFAGNWDGGIPNRNENAIIPDLSTTTNRYPIVSAGQTYPVNDINVVSSGTITINSGGGLAIFGSYFNTGNMVAKRNVRGDLAYSAIGATVQNKSVSDITPTADLAYAFMTSLNLFQAAQNLESGYGYFVAFDQTDPEISLSGIPHTGTVRRPTVYSNNGINDDFELVSNPFNAAISRTAFVAENGSGGSGIIDGTIYVWQDGGANLPDGTRSGNYITVNAAGSATGGSYGDDIRSGQGFFVASSGLGDVVFSSEMQTLGSQSNSDAGFFRENPLNLGLRLSGLNQEDELLIETHAEGTKGFDRGLDAHKFFNPGLSFYSLLEDAPLAIQSIDKLSEELEIPLGYISNESGIFELSLSNTEGIEAQNIVLVDTKEGTRFSLVEGQTVAFVLDKGREDNRFKLLLNPEPVLAMQDQLADFAVSIEGNEAITIQMNDVNAERRVALYSVSGKLLLDKMVPFLDGTGTVAVEMHTEQIYILRVDNKSMKFILN